MKELKRLPKDIQEKWKANYIDQHGNDHFHDLFEDDAALYDIIAGGFTWERTPEGGNYWHIIYNNIDQYKLTTAIWI